MQQKNWKRKKNH